MSELNDNQINAAIFNKEMTGLWNLYATIGNDSLKLKDYSSDLAKMVDECGRQVKQAYDALDKARDHVYNTKCQNESLNAENARLKSEVERLRKAGDAIAAIIKPPAHGPGEWDGEYDAWHAAKERRDAK